MKLHIEHDHISTHLGHAIRQKRGISLSLRDLAKQLDTSATVLSRIERGVGLPRNDLFVRIMTWLSVNKNQYREYTSRERY